MTTLAILSRQSWLPNILRSTVKFSGGTREWIRHGQWSMCSPLLKKKAELTVFDLEEFCSASANEIIKYSCAAFESAQSVVSRQQEPRGCAWQFISYYYAAYFAANALMRFSGHSCSNLSVHECAAINEYALLVELGGTDERTKIIPGVYFSSVDAKNQNTLTLFPLQSKGGVHIQFWNGFERYLADLNTSIKFSALPEQDKRDAQRELGLLRSCLGYSGMASGAWLSEVRNAVNYRLEFGAWYPYENGEVTGPELRKIMSEAVGGHKFVLPAISADFPDLQRASRVCAFLLYWLRQSLQTWSDSSSRLRRKQICEGPLTLAGSMD